MRLSELFEEILERPVKYVGTHSLDRILCFIEGYKLALLRNHLPLEDDLRPFDGWVAKRFQIASSHNWANIISFMSVGDDREAISLARELWAEFKTERAGKR